MKLVTWNTQWCRGLDGLVSPRRIVAGAQALAGEGGFDVLCLQEIAQGYPGLPGAPGGQPAELAELLPGHQLFFGAAVDEFTPGAGGRLQRQRFGNLIATRLPVLQVRHHPLPWPAEAGVPSMPRMCSVVTVRHATLGPLRIMTTHLEYYAPRQRHAQAEALAALHGAANDLVAAPPSRAPGDTGSPFQLKAHTPHAVLCGDFNFEPDSAEYRAIQAAPARAGLHDAWPLVHGDKPHPPTFRLFDRTYGPEPISCDFFFVSQSLTTQLKALRVDLDTQVSDHQPMMLVLG